MVRLTENLKGGDDRRFRYEFFAVHWGAIENVSPITGKDHAREVTGRAHELCGGRLFDSSCRRVVIKFDPSREFKRKGRRKRSYDNIL